MKEIQVYETKRADGLLLNANELSQNINESIMEEIQQAIPKIMFHRYPDIENKELIDAYAEVINMAGNKILAGNGSDEMLGLMIGYFLGKGKTLYTLDPDFSMYDYYATMHEATILKYPCQEDGSFDIDAFIEMGRKQGVDMILFSNPSNPTGHALKRNGIDKIIRSFPHIPVIIDEAYAEFANESMLQCVDQYQNLYVTRTLSKAYGLAGARLGFLISNQQNIEELRPKVVPYNISAMSQKVGAIVLKHAKEYQPIVKKTIAQRDWMYQKVKDFTSITFYPSQANYLYGRCDQKEKLLQAFNQQKIVIRDYKGNDSFRITIGSEAENKRVLDMLKKFEKEMASCVS